MKRKPKTTPAEDVALNLQIDALRKEHLRLQKQNAKLKAAKLSLENTVKIQASIVREANRRNEEEQASLSEHLAKRAKSLRSEE